jgi:hypothetical protein
MKGDAEPKRHGVQLSYLKNGQQPPDAAATGIAAATNPTTTATNVTMLFIVLASVNEAPTSAPEGTVRVHAVCKVKGLTFKSA